MNDCAYVVFMLLLALARCYERACMQIDCFPLPIPCFYTVYAEGRNKPFVITETSAAFYLSPINPPDQQATNVDMKRAWCGCPASSGNTLLRTGGSGGGTHAPMKPTS